MNALELEIISISQDLVIKLIHGVSAETDPAIRMALLNSKAETLRDEAKALLSKVFNKNKEVIDDVQAFNWAKQIMEILNKDPRDVNEIKRSLTEADSTNGESFIDTYLDGLVTMASFALEQVEKEGLA